MQLIKCFLSFIIILLSSAVHAQPKADSLFADFDLSMQVPVAPVSRESISKPGSYIRKASGKKGSHPDLIKVYKDSSIAVRKATLMHLSYGNVLAFKTLRTPGYEKVLIFADWDYYYDSLLIRHDTLYFKQTEDDYVRLSILYPARNDTIIMVCGYRTTRYDFLKKISFEPPLKAYRRWFPNAMLDYEETLTLVKKDTCYDLIKAEAEGSSRSNEGYKYLRDKYAAAGLSPFWLVLAGLSYQDKKN
jgi:hypothetical protein